MEETIQNKNSNCIPTPYLLPVLIKTRHKTTKRRKGKDKQRKKLIHLLSITGIKEELL